jgi:hypothetical protein
VTSPFPFSAPLAIICLYVSLLTISAASIFFPSYVDSKRAKVMKNNVFMNNLCPRPSAFLVTCCSVPFDICSNMPMFLLVNYHVMLCISSAIKLLQYYSKYIFASLRYGRKIKYHSRPNFA